MDGAAQPDTPSPVLVVPRGAGRHPGNTDPEELIEPLTREEFALVCRRLGIDLEYPED